MLVVETGKTKADGSGIEVPELIDAGELLLKLLDHTSKSTAVK